MSDPDLSKAYALETPQDSVDLYRAWADTYDQSFAKAHGYIAPEMVAQLFHTHGGSGLILDVGAGTGLVARHLLAMGHTQIHGTDISAEMLAIAQKDSLYTQTIACDITAALPFKPNTYDGIISAGTFTHGHVGPEPISALVETTKPGGLLALSINTKHFTAKGFAAKLDMLNHSICDLTLHDIPLYHGNPRDPHAQDRGTVAVFHKR